MVQKWADFTYLLEFWGLQPQSPMDDGLASQPCRECFTHPNLQIHTQFLPTWPILCTQLFKFTHPVYLTHPNLQILPIKDLAPGHTNVWNTRGPQIIMMIISSVLWPNGPVGLTTVDYCFSFHFSSNETLVWDSSLGMIWSKHRRIGGGLRM